jgi:coproporphyrinogen III oxidase
MKENDLDELSRQASDYFRGVQDRICTALEDLEQRGAGTTRFREDDWQHHSGGGGISRVMIDGRVFEKAGVNFSRVTGTFAEEFAASMPGKGTTFTATGISLVIHPRNPHVPTVHANFRHITQGDCEGRAAWFGGGSDLTPYYPRREDVIHFHRVWKATCERHAVADHSRFKKWCDEYFYLPHRQEARGVGGIFFDNLTGSEKGSEKWIASLLPERPEGCSTQKTPDPFFAADRLHEVFAFVRDAGDQFLPAYVPIVERRMAEPYTDTERRWQLIRRGRYVEFNLLYDRGTMFGLKTGGRVESILMSLPLYVMWGYNEMPVPGSPEAELLEFLKPRDWAGES